MIGKNICLSGNTLENIQKMSPLLSEKQQYVTFGMILAQIMETRSKGSVKMTGIPQNKEEQEGGEKDE